jgi:hypothetical protein
MLRVRSGGRRGLEPIAAVPLVLRLRVAVTTVRVPPISRVLLHVGLHAKKWATAIANKNAWKAHGLKHYCFLLALTKHKALRESTLLVRNNKHACSWYSGYCLGAAL